MKPNRPRSSRLKILAFSILVSSFVLVASLVIQWLVYDDWQHRTGPLRIVGTSIAAVITFVFMVRWQYAVREKQREMVRRFEVILQMNDRIRNKLQAIECVTYLAQPEATQSVRQAVNAIDEVLRGVLADSGDLSSAANRNTTAIDESRASRKSA